MADRLAVAAIAKRFGISLTRVYQLIKSGDLTKGEDRKIDVAQADAWRAESMLKHPAQTLLTANSNGFFVSAPKGGAIAEADAEFDADLYEAPAAPLAAPQTPAAPRVQNAEAREARDQAMEINTLRAQKLRGEIELAQHKRQREAGLLIEKTAVRDQGIEAGKVITSLLNALPTEVAGIFADPERRAEVRTKVQERVDQMIYALHAAVSAAEDSRG